MVSMRKGRLLRREVDAPAAPDTRQRVSDDSESRATRTGHIASEDGQLVSSAHGFWPGASRGRLMIPAIMKKPQRKTRLLLSTGSNADSDVWTRGQTCAGQALRDLREDYLRYAAQYPVHMEPGFEGRVTKCKHDSPWRGCTLLHANITSCVVR